MIRFLSLLLLIALLTSPLWLAVLALDPLPRALDTATLSVNDVENAKRLLRDNDPRRLREGERRQVVLSERELNLMLRYALPQDSAVRVGLVAGIATITISTKAPSNPLGSWLNADLILLRDGQSLKPMAINVGRIRIPEWMTAGLVTLGGKLLEFVVPEVAAVIKSVESLEANEGTLALTYRWRAGLLQDLADRGRELALPAELREGILLYYASIGRIAPTLEPGASLAEVLVPLFAQAAARSRSGLDAADEHRALILALGMAIKGADPNGLNAAGKTPRRAPTLPVTLHGRRDLAQHFAISAALAAGGGSRLADAIGVFKELSDSQGGSGFSFPDLLADRAGVVLAERATGVDALQLQRRIAGAPSEALFMPPINRLPEGLQELEFRRRYQDLDTQDYARMRNEVERRINALPLYR